MTNTNTFKAIAVAMAMTMSNVPQLALAETAQGMISTMAVVEKLSRQQAENNILAQVNRAEVQQRLQDLGISKDEVSARMANLTDEELRDFSKQMDKAQYGSGVVGILLIVALVLLIIYLARRV